MSIWRVLGIHCVILKAAAGALEQPGDPRWPQICTDEHWGTASIVWGMTNFESGVMTIENGHL